MKLCSSCVKPTLKMSSTRVHTMITRSQARNAHALQDKKQQPKKMVPISTEDLPKRVQILERYTENLERENRYLRAQRNALKTKVELLEKALTLATTAPAAEPTQTRDFSKMARYLTPGTAVYVGSIYDCERMTGFFSMNAKKEPVIISHGMDYKSPSEFYIAYAKRYKKPYIASEDDWHWHNVGVFATNKRLDDIYEEGERAGV